MLDIYPYLVNTIERGISMKNKIINVRFSVLFGVLFLFGLLVANSLGAKAAEVNYVTDFVIKIGDSGEDDLIDENFNVLHPNLVNDDGEKVWIGYKTSSDAKNVITDIKLDNKFDAKLVKEESGNGIVAFYFLSADVNGISNFDKVMPITNDGSIVISDDSGEPVVFNSDNSKGYLCLIKEKMIRDYIGVVKVASGSSKKEAITKLFKKGCEFYVDKNFSHDSSGFVFLGYSRTNDVDKAIKDIIGIDEGTDIKLDGYEKIDDFSFKGKNFYTTTDEKYGNPFVYLEFLENDTDIDFTGEGIANLISAGSENRVGIPFMLNSEGYQKLEDSEEDYVITNVDCIDDTVTGIVYATQKEELDDKKSDKDELLQSLVKESKKDNKDNKDLINDIVNSAENGDIESSEDKKSEEVGDDQNVDGATDENSDGSIDTPSSEGAVGKNDESITDVDGNVGTALNEKGSKLPSTTETIILIFIIILIPVVTIVIKKKNT